MTASIARGSSQSWTLKVANTVWAYVGPAGSSGVQMAAGAGFRQYITVTQ
jgi:hypothetical protein